MKIAIVGCGFVADYYLITLRAYPQLEVLGVTDRDPERARRLAAANGLRHFKSLAELCDDRHIEMVLNLTNPASHFEVSKTCLEAGKQAYTEKPMAMQIDQ